MQENNPVSTPEVVPPVVVEQPKQSNFLIILLSILLLVSVFVAGFFAFQTQKLVKQLSESRNQNLVTPVPTAIPDPTANWKTINGQHWFFKVPNDWKYIKCSGGSTLFVDPKIVKDTEIECNFGGVGYLFTAERDNNKHQIAVTTTPDPYGMYTTVSNKENIIIGGNNGIKQNVNIFGGQGEGKYIYVYIQKPEFTDVFIFSDPSKNQLFDQILSTFKFLE